MSTASKMHSQDGGCRSSGGCQVHIPCLLALILGPFWVKLKNLRNYLFNLTCSAQLLVHCVFCPSDLGNKWIYEGIHRRVENCLWKAQGVQWCWGMDDGNKVEVVRESC